MFEKKKIIIFGPPGVGKSTIKKVFFEMVSPFKLMNKSIEPTRGVDSKIFTLYNYELGVFDLAGQENENWFSHEREIFLNANLLLCVFDINMYIKEIQDFFFKLLNIHKEMNLKKASIVVFFHKVDLIDKILLHHKINAFKDFLKTNLAINENIPVFPTSIAADFFLTTYDYVAEILGKIISIKNLGNRVDQINELRKDLEILINYDVYKTYNINVLFYDFNLQHKDALIHLRRLKKLGLVEILSDKNHFSLTEKTRIFKSDVIIDDMNQNQIKINRILDGMFLFSNLNEK